MVVHAPWLCSFEQYRLHRKGWQLRNDGPQLLRDAFCIRDISNYKSAKLSYLGHVLMENRNGMIMDALLTQADGIAERDAAMILRYRQHQRDRRGGRRRPMTLGADKAYDTRDFVSILRQMNVRPHVARNVKLPPTAT
jgi:hypothetical protein